MNRENALRFYSGGGDEGHPKYCSRYRAQRCGAFIDPVEDDWQE